MFFFDVGECRNMTNFDFTSFRWKFRNHIISLSVSMDPEHHSIMALSAFLSLKIKHQIRYLHSICTLVICIHSIHSDYNKCICLPCVLSLFKFKLRISKKITEKDSLINTWTVNGWHITKLKKVLCLAPVDLKSKLPGI